MHTNTPIAAAPIAPPPRSARIEELPAIRRKSLQLGEVRIDRVRGEGRWAASDEARCGLLFATAEGAVIVRGNDAPEKALPPDHWIVHAQRPLELHRVRGCELVRMSFPVTLLSRSLAGKLLAAPPLALPTSGASRMCLAFLRACLGQSEASSQPVADTLQDSLVELAKLAIIDQACTRGGETMRETVRTRIHGFIHRNLVDPDLTIERIAKRMQCSKRYLHKVFSEDGETLNQYIWSQRLELCRDRLTRSELAAKSITEIAFACGFSNAAHFSRSFRTRYGEAPRDYRRSALGT